MQKYDYTDAEIIHGESNSYIGSCKTIYHGQIDFSFTIFGKAKKTGSGHKIIGEVKFADGKEMALFENEYKGMKTGGGTIEKGFYINIKKELSSNDIYRYKVTLSENKELFEEQKDGLQEISDSHKVVLPF